MSAKVTETPVAATASLAVSAASLVLLDVAVIKADQDSIRSRVMSIDTDVHANAVQCLMHAEKHGDTSLFARLLIDILDEKTGYNRRGLIRWMREFSPMELNGKKITLTGLDLEGKRRPFRIDEANKTPFYLSEALNQQSVKPIFQDTLVSKFDTMVREFEASWKNTKREGDHYAAIDPKKPFYMGTVSAGAKLFDFIEKGKALRENLASDDTREIYLAKQRLAKDAAAIAEMEGASKETKAA